MRSSLRLAAAALLAIATVPMGGCPWFTPPPGDNANDNGAVDDNAGGDNTNDNTGGGGGGNGNDNAGGGDDQPPKITVGLPAKNIGYDLIGLHDPGSARYDANCIGCHGERTNEVALDGVTPAAHSTMQFGFLGEGNARCVSCHQNAPDFLNHSAGGLRKLVNVERDLAADSSCTSCHSSGNLAFYVRGF